MVGRNGKHGLLRSDFTFAEIVNPRSAGMSPRRGSFPLNLFQAGIMLVLLKTFALF
jgi:hypothetical protein